MKNIALLVVTLLILAGSQVFGQNAATIRGVIADGKSKTPLPNAYVQLLSLPDSAKRTVATNVDGQFVFDNVRRGAYFLRVSYIGYQNFQQRIRATGQPLDLGSLGLTEDAKQLNEVKVVGRLATGSQQGDTVQFNAGAFKTNPDANAEDLIQKMPGVTVENGTVKAQGENVQQVLVDGKPFFGNDPTAALRNLPAEVIDKVQVFDQLSDQSQFTGINDGNTQKTINIITKPTMRNGTFGKVYGGYGTDDRYQVGGSINRFEGVKRFTVLAQSNNINQQNFSAEDLLGVTANSAGGGRGGFGGGGGGRPQGGGGRPSGGGRGGEGGDGGDFMVRAQNGVATTHALGLNYSDEWGKKIKVSGSYFFNYADNASIKNTLRQFVIPSLSGQEYSENSTAISKNINHRLNFRFEYTIDQYNSILIRPRLSLQQNDGTSNLLGETLLNGGLLNRTSNDFTSNLLGYNFNNDILIRHRFKKQGRTISWNIGTSLSNKSGDNLLYAENIFVSRGNTQTSITDQSANLDAKGWGLTSSLNYTEPLSRKSFLSFNYDYSYAYNDSDKQTLRYSEQSKSYSILDTLLTNTFSSDYATHQVGTGYRYQTPKLQIMTNVRYQYAALDNEQVFPRTFDFGRSFQNLLPMAMITYNIKTGKNLRFNYRTQTTQPSVSQLQEVVDNTNPLQLSTGNANLVQSFGHNMSLRYLATNIGASTNFLIFVNADLTDKFIGNSNTVAITATTLPNGIVLQPGAQFSQPVNLDGRYALRGFLSYGMPIKFIKTNLNLSLSSNYSHTPGRINDQINFANSQTHGVGVVLSSNISPKVDFTVSSNSNFSKVSNTLQSQLNTNYFNQNSRFRTNLMFGKGFVFQTELSHQYYAGLSSAFNQNFFLWNMSLGKKLFKNQQGDLRITAFDLLKQNNSIQRSVTESYIEDGRSNVLQRYFLMVFTYNIRHYKNTPQAGQPSGVRRQE